MDSEREHSWASIALFFSCFQFQMSCRRSVWQHRRPQDLGRTLSALCICFMDVLSSSSTQKSCYNQSSTQTTTHWLSRWLWGEINGANIISQRSLALISIFRFCASSFQFDHDHAACTFFLGSLSRLSSSIRSLSVFFCALFLFRYSRAHTFQPTNSTPWAANNFSARWVLLFLPHRSNVFHCWSWLRR